MISARMDECPICGKKFSPAPQHSYAIRGCGADWVKLVCSCHCMREWERKREAKPEANRRKATVEKELAGEFGIAATK